MIFFLLGYLATAVVCFKGYEIVALPVVAAVFFFGAVFVHIGISLQSRLGAASLKALKNLERQSDALSVANRELEAAKTRLEAQAADRNESLRSVSHDLGELSRNILLCADSVTRRFGDAVPAEALHRLDRLRANAEESVGLLGALKSVADIQSSRGPLAIVDLADVARAVADEFAGNIRAKGIDFSSANAWPTIRCDERLIRDAIQGLVDNAITYIGAGGDKRIELGWSESGTHYVLWVRDNGIGVASEEEEGVFRIFHRNRHVPYREGRKGIGLAMVKAIAGSHDGEAWVESKLGEGSTFYFSLAKATVELLPPQSGGQDRRRCRGTGQLELTP
ncbi:MAG: sensor histidine kinase [Planctomycetota bacterium]|jgi:light-regulated signal transduction histidine kinase (bacteriophytochrome)